VTYQVQEVKAEDVIRFLSNQVAAERHWCRRYRDALRRIADGKGDPQGIAIEALGDDEDDDS
jgi:hypothetical protein